MPELMTTPDQPAPAAKSRERSLVLVAGSGRSGTSLASGILQRLGYHIPQPEVPADATNPRGFAESQWVVDFHTQLLRRAGVQTSDARPAAWVKTAELCLDDVVRNTLSTWLREQFRESPALLVKDPRLSWFIPLWRQVAAEAGTDIGFLTMLRHPGAVVDSKQRWYGGWQGEVGRASGWVHQVLFTERATRDSPRVFVRYDELLEDWTSAVARVGEALDLDLLRHAPAHRMRSAHELVDVGLSRSRSDWGQAEIPERLRVQADEAWELLTVLVDAPDAECEGIFERLDTLRDAYTQLYLESEAIVQSSIAAHPARRPPQRAKQSRALRLARRVPKPVRHALPLGTRVRLARLLRRLGSSRSRPAVRA
jgi:hypothetical protein